MVRLAALCLGALLLAGCQNGDPPKEGASYQLKGIVVASDPVKGEVSIDGQAIPGFMGAMIMPYKLAQPGIASELHPGDHLTARLRVSGSTSTLDQIDITAQAKPDYKPSKTYNAPQEGQAVPNFKFVNQGGETLSVETFRGKVLLVTFIYTRCPLPDYCIRLSRNFATIQKKLAADPSLSSKAHMLSISFDPVYDTPQVLRTYGHAYTTSFADWDFVAAPASELDAVEAFFDVAVSPGAQKTLTHSLSTVVVAPDGKIFRWYPNNDWDPSTVWNDMRQAAEKRQEPAGASQERSKPLHLPEPGIKR